MNNPVALITILIVGFLIAYFIGRKRKIGFWWSLFFCWFLTAIGGLIITLSSKKLDAPNPSPSKVKSAIGGVLIVIFGLSLILAINSIGSFDSMINQNYGGDESVKQLMNQNAYNSIALSMGFIGLGVYLILLGRKGN